MMEKINLFPTTVGKFNLIDYTDWEEPCVL